MPESAAERLEAIRAQLPPATQLLAVSKGHPVDAIRELAALGQRSFGESRLQEASAKQAELVDLPGLDWHFIGRLQANKVRPVLKQFAWVHSIDSVALAQRVARIAAEEGVSPRVFLQVKLRPDPSKGGFAAAELPPGLAGAAGAASTAVDGADDHGASGDGRSPAPEPVCRLCGPGWGAWAGAALDGHERRLARGRGGR